MKILNIEAARYDDDLRKQLDVIGEVTYVDCASQDEFNIALWSEEFEVVLLRLGIALDRNALDACPSLRLALTPTTGLDHIDTELAWERDVDIISLRGATSLLQDVRSTAEHTWALLLAVMRHIPAAHDDVIEGHWRRDPFVADELFGQKLGIVGFGRLGRMVAQFGSAFGMRIIAHDNTPHASDTDVEFADLQTTLSESDVVTLHLPLDPSTKGILNTSRFAEMKDTAYLVNTSRGELIDEAALIDSLSRDGLAGAALDVLAGDGKWARERPIEHPLVMYAENHQNLILTPHIGGYGRQSIRRTRSFIVEQLAKHSKPRR